MALGQERYIGRQPHLRLVAELVDKTRQGSGGLLLVSGEPGLGKTRLAEEATRLASAAGLAVAWGQSADADGAPPYLPWTQIFTQLGSSFLRRRALESRNASRAEASRFRVFDRAVDVLRESSAGGPLLLVLDDLHAADASSLGLLWYAASQLPTMPVLVLAVYRQLYDDSSPFGRVLGDIRRQRGVRHLDLRRLSPGEADDLARQWLREPANTAIVSSIEARARGNPLFIRELAILLAERGTATELPSTLRDVFAARLVGLSDDQRRLLSAAAVIGVEFQERLLASVVGATGATAREALEAAAQRRLVAGDPTGWSFTHPLLKEVLYGELPGDDRARLHAAVARNLRDPRPDVGASLADGLAHHLRQAVTIEGPGPALAATLVAAQQAEEGLAYEDAANQLGFSVNLAAQAGLSGKERTDLLLRLGRCRLRAGDLTAAWQACRVAAADARNAADWSAVAEAATLITGVVIRGSLRSEIDRLCQDCLAALPRGELRLRARLLAQRVLIADIWRPRADPSLALEALRNAEASGDPDARFMALQARLVDLAAPEHCLERLSGGDRALLLAQESGRPEYAVWGRTWRIDALWELGRRPQLDAEVAALAALVDDLKEPLHRCRLLLIQAAIKRMEGRFRGAFALLDQAREIGQAAGVEDAVIIDAVARASISMEMGGSEQYAQLVERQADSAAPGDAFSRLWQCGLLGAAGRVEDVRRQWPLLLELFITLPRNIAWVAAASFMAEMCCLVEDAATAPSLYDALRPFADNQVVSDARGGSRGPVSLYLGNLAALLGEWDDAEARLQRAVAGAATMGSPPYEGIARYWLASTLLKRGRPRDRAFAVHQVELAGRTARLLGMQPLAMQTDRLSVAVRVRPDTGALSAREAEVARLVAEGLTNPGIAKRLNISPRTAENHVQHILNKLGFDSRAQIAAWVAAGGLSRPHE